MQQSALMKRHIKKIGFSFTILIVAVIVTFAMREYKTTRPVAGFTLARGEGSRMAYVRLVADSFSPAAGTLSGTANFSIWPRVLGNSAGRLAMADGEPQLTLAIDGAVLYFYRRQMVGGSPALVQQGSSEIIELKRAAASSEIHGEGDFNWNVRSIVPTFRYPFDSYVLDVDPSLTLLRKEDGFLEEIDTLEVDLRVPNLRMTRIRNQSVVMGASPYEIKLSRPIALRVIALAVAILAVAWLVHLTWFAEPEGYVGQLLTFFVGIWGIRTTLLAGISYFPLFLDYVALSLSVAAAGIILSRWSQARFGDTQRCCPRCKLKINAKADRCPHCTSELVGFPGAGGQPG
jgi:hypothetical protein